MVNVIVRCKQINVHKFLVSEFLTNLNINIMVKQTKSSKEDCFPCIEDQKFTADESINENMNVDCYDRYSSDSDRSSFNIETENITSNLNLNNSVKLDLYCNSVKKYVDCMK